MAGLVAAWAVGCGPLGGCGTPRAQSVGAETPEEGHPVLVEGAPAKGPEGTAGDGTDEAPPAPLLQLSAEALAARIAGQRASFGKDDLFGEYARGLPSRPAPAADPSLGTLDALPGSAGSGDGSANPPAAPAIDGNALGIFVPMHAPPGAMDHFYEALRALKRGDDDDGKVRVLLYGASHTAADIYPTYLRAYLRERFGDGGPGFVALAKTNKYYRLLAWTLETSKGWLVEHAQKKKAREDGLFGLLGASTSATKKRDVTRLLPQVEPPEGPHKTTYELYFLRQPGGGKFTVKIDGKEQKPVNTKAKEIGAGYATFTVDGGPHEVEIRPVGKGEVRLFGMTTEYDTPGVVVDTLGINGTRASNHLKWHEGVWADNFRRRKPDLVVLAYGTNESLDEDVPIGHYKAELGQVIDRMKAAAPEVSCLLVGPGDFPLKAQDGAYLARARTIEIVAAQAEVAAAKGCAFWDALAFMGGAGSMVLWAEAQPAMGRPDLIHLTRRGYVRMGMAITDALMDAFDAVDVPTEAPETLIASERPGAGPIEAVAAPLAAP